MNFLTKSAYCYRNTLVRFSSVVACAVFISCGSETTVPDTKQPSVMDVPFGFPAIPAPQDNPLTLAVMLLKLVLISPNSRTHLEVCIALLIGHYQKKAPDKCQGFIKFLEICKIALTIYAENVQYNLVKMSNGQTDPNLADLDAYRVFSLHKTPPKKE